MKKPKVCKGCRYCVPYYGKKDKQGKSQISNFWCNKKCHTIHLIKFCEFQKKD